MISKSRQDETSLPQSSLTERRAYNLQNENHRENLDVEKVPLKATEKDDEEVVVDLTDVTTRADLKNIWASDPFLFYSIPEIHKNAYKVSDSEDSSSSSSDDLNDLDDRDESSLHAIFEKSGLRPSGIPHLHKIPVSRPVHQPQQVHPLKQQAPLPPVRESNDSAAPDADGNSGNDNNSNGNSNGHVMQRRRSSLTRRNYSCPAEMLKKADISYSLFHGAKPVVKRRHRLSTEAHTSLVAEDFLLTAVVAGGNAGGDGLRGDSVGGKKTNAASAAAVKTDKNINWDVGSDSDEDDDDDYFDDPLRLVLKKMASVRVTRKDHGESGSSSGIWNK